MKIRWQLIRQLSIGKTIRLSHLVSLQQNWWLYQASDQTPGHNGSSGYPGVSGSSPELENPQQDNYRMVMA